MRISVERLSLEALSTGFRPDVLEKVLQLLSLLESIRSHPFLKTRLALKGGTALNLFVFSVPRLSVDIELNYIGAPSLFYGLSLGAFFYSRQSMKALSPRLPA